MKIKSLLFGLLLVAAAPAIASTITFNMTNSLGAPDTNYFFIQPIQDPVLANGGIITKGLRTRCYPRTNDGFFSTNLLVGFYQMTNQFLGSGIIFQSYADTNTYNVDDVALSGFNTYRPTGVRRITSNDGTIGVTPANGVGIVDLSGANTNGGSQTFDPIVWINIPHSVTNKWAWNQTDSRWEFNGGIETDGSFATYGGFLEFLPDLGRFSYSLSSGYVFVDPNNLGQSIRFWSGGVTLWAITNSNWGLNSLLYSGPSHNAITLANGGANTLLHGTTPPAYSAVDVSSADITGVLQAAAFPALTGDVTTTAGSLATTFARFSTANSWSGSNYFGSQLTPAGGLTSTNANWQPIELWANNKNTDGSLWLVLGKPPFYPVATNYLGTLGIAMDSVVVGDEPNQGDSSAGPDFPLKRIADSVILGEHCASQATNINSSTFIGYGAGQGSSGSGPYYFDHSFFLAGDVGQSYGATNYVNSIFLGSPGGSALGSGGGVTNVIMIGFNSAVANGSLNNTNDILIGNNVELPTGASGEMSIGNLIYAQKMNAHGGGNVGIGVAAPATTLEAGGSLLADRQLFFKTNAFPLAAGTTWNLTQNYQRIITNADMTITALGGLTNNLLNWGCLWYSNSDSATHFVDLTALAVTVTGSSSTNKLYVASAKTAVFSIASWGIGQQTNLVTAPGQ